MDGKFYDLRIIHPFIGRKTEKIEQERAKIKLEEDTNKLFEILSTHSKEEVKYKV